MNRSEAVCPQCGSRKIIKDRVSGADTGDFLCADCKFTNMPPAFQTKSTKKINNQ